MVELSNWQWGIGAGITVALLIVGGWLYRQPEAPVTTKQNAPPLSEQNNELHEPYQQLEATGGELKATQTIQKQLTHQLEETQKESKEIHPKKIEAEEGYELVKLQLAQTEKEAKHLFEENLKYKNKLEKLSSELNEQKQLRQQLQARNNELKDTRDEAELTLLQLHQVQEELEHYFLENQKLASNQALAPKQLEQLKRIKLRLIKKFKTLPSQENERAALEQIVNRQQNVLVRLQRLHLKQ